MEKFGEVALIIGDLHIPKAIGVPSQFKELLVPGKIYSILVNGKGIENRLTKIFKFKCAHCQSRFSWK